ncbi:hypothetical protein Anas_08954 [Armadillidium nasatum]|uniref:Uncharacterized protein n=1 Tax=Armadillidium nasatum TaxID=96803 RepID=A0A5N5SRF7_9CRUS|nr:hypothetical protein Anas_08954 [Armadillidium nasatum]
MNIYSVVHNVIRLKLYEESQKFSDQQKKSINQILIESGHAVKSEEFFMSKQNHKLRTIYGSGVYSTSSKLLLSSTTCLSQSSLNVSRLESNTSGSCRNRKGLNGPYSPLEMKFIALTRKGFAKGVLIDNSSVNSTALDLEPQNPYDRLIVASQVVLNPTESKIVLRNTTLMPALPGMLPLCLLIFSPFVELRTAISISDLLCTDNKTISLHIIPIAFLKCLTQNIPNRVLYVELPGCPTLLKFFIPFLSSFYYSNICLLSQYLILIFNHSSVIRLLKFSSKSKNIYERALYTQDSLIFQSHCVENTLQKTGNKVVISQVTYANVKDFSSFTVNEDGWQYIGALCGLGSNPDNGEPIYPEDDIEVPFDFNFTDEDLSKINVLRYLMSCILKQSEEGNPENLLKTQEFLRKLILEIMSETRHYVTLETFSKSHKWNQVPKNKIIRPNINDPDGENFIWPQHNGIKLEDQSKRMNLQANLKYLRKLERR